VTCNKDYQDCKSCRVDCKSAKCKPKHPKPNKILLECGEGTGSRTFTSSDDLPFQLAHVTLDTTCLNRPEVLIKFSSLVSMGVLDNGGTVRLQYELFRVCGSGEPVCLGIWMFEKVDINTFFFDNIEESFSFIFCECQIGHGCCDYFVTVTPVEITNANATVSNGRMAALSGSSCDYLEKYEDFDSKDTKLNLKNPKPKEILLECGQGNGGIVFREPTDPPTNIAHVTIDTNCLNRPEVLIDFSSIIKFNSSIINLVLKFELFRVCNNEVPVSRGTWRFARTGADFSAGIDEAFSFISCETLTCPGCCEYFVTVTVLDISGVAGSTDILAMIDNGRMIAIAQSTMDCNCHDNYESLDEKCYNINYQSVHPKPKKILLECGEGSGYRSFTSSNDAVFQLAHVTIDTTSLCKAMVNVEFSSIVSFERLRFTSGNARLQYELFRVCDGKTSISLGVWSIDKINFSGDFSNRITNIFDFTFCDCTTCSNCCEYFVTVTPVEITEDVIRVTVGNGRIAAIAQER